MAQASYRTDFFDATRRPTVTFDKTHFTWSMRNQSVERIIRFDKASGGLETVELRDLRTHHSLRPAPGGEGVISFASPIVQPPTLLTAWKETTSEPDKEWASPGYDDRGWKSSSTSVKPITAPPVTDNKNRASVWYRTTVDQKLLRPGRPYALYFPGGFPATAEIYCDGELIQRYPTDLSASGRPEVLDLPAKCHVLAVRTILASPFIAYMAEVGTSPQNLDLRSDWTYSHHAINVADNNSLVLTIHLSGSNRKEGFEIDVCYQIYPGEEPTVAKWLTFISHRKSRFILDAASLERWDVTNGWKGKDSKGKDSKGKDSKGKDSKGKDSKGKDSEDKPQTSTKSLSRNVCILTHNTTGDLLLTAHFGRLAHPVLEADGKTLADVVDLGMYVQPDNPIQTPHAITAFWHGPYATGQFLYQLYTGQYNTNETPFSIPIAYDTRLAPAQLLDAVQCARMVPLAAGMGAQAFVIDDGWQSNRGAGTGRYGDWQIDRTRFPMGLLPISTLVRLNHMRFGVWIDPKRVDARSLAARQHPEWLYSPFLPYQQYEDNVPIEQMCFTGVWAKQLAETTLEVCRATSVSYLKTRFKISDACIKSDHDHGVGRSSSAEEDAWEAFREVVHKADPTFVQVQDPFSPEYWQHLMSDPAHKRVATWIDNADHLLARHTTPLPYRQNTETNGELLAMDPFLLPPFGVSGEALCHLPTDDKPTEDETNYLWSFVAASGCTFEVQGDLEKMDEGEKQAAKRWIEWTDSNRPWLAFSQSVTVDDTSRPNRTASQDIRALLHLRNLYKNRYGYLCLWNQSATEQTVAVKFDPADYFVRMHFNATEIRDIDAEKSLPFKIAGGVIEIPSIRLSAHGYAILEIKVKRPLANSRLSP